MQTQGHLIIDRQTDIQIDRYLKNVVYFFFFFFLMIGTNLDDGYMMMSNRGGATKWSKE